MDNLLGIIILTLSIYLIYIIKNKVSKIAIATLIAGLIGIVIGKVLPIDVTPFIILGSIYMQLIRWFIIPLIIVMGCTSFLRLKSLNVKSSRYIKYLIFTTSLAATIGVIVSIVTKVGRKINFLRITEIEFENNVILKGIGNLVYDKGSFNIFLLLILSIIIGYVLFKEDNIRNEKIKVAKELLLSIQEILFSTIKFLLGFMPYVVFGIMTTITVTNTMRILGGVISVIIIFYFMAVLQICIVHIPLVLSAGITPKDFLKGIFKSQKHAFISQSSSGTAPIIEEELVNNFNVRKDIAKDIPKLGASIGMNACQGIYPALVTIMVANIFSVRLSMNNCILIIFLITILTLVFNSMPGIATFTSMTVLIIMGLPIEAIVVATISDIIIDKMRTLTNVTGVAAMAIHINNIDVNKNIIDNCDII